MHFCIPFAFSAVFCEEKQEEMELSGVLLRLSVSFETLDAAIALVVVLSVCTSCFTFFRRRRNQVLLLLFRIIFVHFCNVILTRRRRIGSLLCE